METCNSYSTFTELLPREVEWVPSPFVCSDETKSLFQNKLKNKFKEFQNGRIILKPQKMMKVWLVKGFDAFGDEIQEKVYDSCDGWDLEEKDSVIILKWSGMIFRGRIWRKLCRDVHRALKRTKQLSR